MGLVETIEGEKADVIGFGAWDEMGLKTSHSGYPSPELENPFKINSLSKRRSESNFIFCR